MMYKQSRTSKTVSIAILFSMLITLLAGCYRNELVESQQVGIKLVDGAVIDVVGPGRYTDGAGGWERWATFARINTSNITTSWGDSSLVTKDKQPIGIDAAITFSRMRDPEAVKAMYVRYNTEAINDDALKALVASKVPGVFKTVTTKYTLDQMLGISGGESAVGREITTQEVTDLLTVELQKIYVELTAVEITNISASESFMKALDVKAQAQIDIEVSNTQTKLVVEQLAKEKALTEIELEKARRDNLVKEESSKAYVANPQLLELEKLRLLGGVLGKGDVIIYVPEGTDITSVLTQSPVTPIE